MVGFLVHLVKLHFFKHQILIICCRSSEHVISLRAWITGRLNPISIYLSIYLSIYPSLYPILPLKPILYLIWQLWPDHLQQLKNIFNTFLKQFMTHGNDYIMICSYITILTKNMLPGVGKKLEAASHKAK